MKRVFSMIVGLAVALSALQAQNAVTVGNVSLQKGESAVVSVELTNELAFSAFQIDLKLPDGFSVATTINEDDEEVLDIALNADRKKSTHLLTYNVLDNGAVRIASYSSANAAYKGTSGEIVRLRIVAADEMVAGDYTARFSKVLFSTSEPVAEYDLGEVGFHINYSKGGEIVVPNRSVEVHAGQYGRCVFEGNVIEPNGSYALPNAFEDGTAIKLLFAPLDGYKASSMKRNGVSVEIRDNMYEETVTEDVVFSDVSYSTIVDTLVVTETVEVEKVVEKVDTIIITEAEVLPIPVITCDITGMVSIACDLADVTIFYAINGDPLEGRIYVGPFKAPADAVISAVAVKRGEMAVLNLVGEGVAQAQMRVVSRRYYTEGGVAVASPEKGVTIVVVEYEDGTTHAYKMVKK